LAIAKGRFIPPQRNLGKQLRINDLVRISPVRLIDENDQQVGVVELLEAKRRAKEAGLDLVEVAPQSTPPVCRIMDYGKWKYQQKKKEQKARSHSKQSELKEVRLRPGTDDHDLGIKVERARTFLGEGDKVQFTLLFRRREMMHRDIGIATLRKIRDALLEVSKVESEPRLMGKRMTMVLSPDRKPKQAGPAAPGTAPGTTPGVAPAGATPPGAPAAVRSPAVVPPAAAPVAAAKPPAAVVPPASA
jgi:translation initiation factor IF-3